MTAEIQLTNIRERHQREYHAYYERHPEQTLKDQARQDRYQSGSRENASRHGEAWTTGDLESALRLQQPIMVSAQDAERTYAAIRQGRYRFIRKHGLRNSLLKDEDDEYDALIRREDFTVDDLIQHDDKWRTAFELTVPKNKEGKPAPPRAEIDWAPWEVEMIKDPTISHAALAVKLGRTPGAVAKKRQRLTLAAKAAS